MTPQEIRDAITASAEIHALVPDTTAIAAALSAGRTRYRATEIGKGTILQVLGLPAGNAVIDAILAAPDYRHIKELLEQGRLRLDIAAQGGLLQPLVIAGVMTQAQHDALCEVAMDADHIPEFEVRCAIFADDGSLLV